MISPETEEEQRGTGAAPSRCYQILSGTISGIDYLCTGVACFFTVMMGAVITTSTIMRYGFQSGLFWSGEFVALTFPWLVMAGAVLAYNRDMHIRVELIAAALPDQVGKPIGRLIDAGVALTTLFIALTSGKIVSIASNQALSTLGVSLSWAYAALPAGFAMLGILAVLRVFGFRYSPSHSHVTLEIKRPAI